MKVRTMKKTWIVGVALMIAALDLAGCSRASQPGWKVTATGLKLDDVYWCDSTHVAAQYTGGGAAAPYVFEWFDVAHPKLATQVELPGEASPRRVQHLMGCSGGNVLLVGTTTFGDPAESAIYAVPAGGSPTLLASPKLLAQRAGRSRSVNLPAKLITLAMPRHLDGKTYSVDARCAAYVAPAFNVLCFDSQFERLLALGRFAIVDYLWEDPVYLAMPDGSHVRVANPQPQRHDKSGKPIVKAAYLYGLDRQVIARLDEDPVFQVERMNFAVDAQEAWLYSTCKEKTKSVDYMNDFDRVCRYRLDGMPHAWEQVFQFAPATSTGAPIQSLSLDRNGNVFFNMLAPNGDPGGIWKFDAASHKLEHILVTRPHEYYLNPQVAADGRTLLFEQNNAWNIAQQ
jgi:hypothetical protein